MSQSAAEPQWHLVGTEWHMVIGNRSVAKLSPNFAKRRPQYKWLSVLDDEFSDEPWHAVEFGGLEIARDHIEQWWHHMCRGEAFHCHCK